MRKIHLILVGILILAVVLSGCAGKKTAEQSQQVQGQGLEGNISVPGEKDLAIEGLQTTDAENVDMGSLI